MKEKTSGVKKGKYFEQYVVKKLNDADISYIRLRDVSTVNNRKTRGTKNPCDYLIFQPSQPPIFLECKACKGKRLPIARITQLKDLEKFLEVGNCLIAINYYDLNDDGSKKKDNCKKVVVNVEDILNKDIKSIKYDDEFTIDFQDWMNTLN